MKKLFPVAAIAVFAMMFTSCKKDYTCTCTVSAGGVSSSATYTITKTTKKDAESKCTAYQTSTAGMTYTCHL